jgi:hypothetical protein
MTGAALLMPVIRKDFKKLIKPLNIYHQAKRMQKREVNDPERTRGRKYHRSFSNTSGYQALIASLGNASLEVDHN